MCEQVNTINIDKYNTKRHVGKPKTNPLASTIVRHFKIKLVTSSNWILMIGESDGVPLQSGSSDSPGRNDEGGHASPRDHTPNLAWHKKHYKHGYTWEHHRP